MPTIVVTEEREQLLLELAQRAARELREPSPHLFENRDFEFVEISYVSSEVEDTRISDEARNVRLGARGAADEAPVDVGAGENALDDPEVPADQTGG